MYSVKDISFPIRAGIAVAALVAAPIFVSLSTSSPAGAAGILPPYDPPSNITFDVMPQCSEVGDTSDACVDVILHDINYGLNAEGLPPMVLPNGFEQMSDAEQLLVVTNLERGARGLSQFAGLSSTLDTAAALGGGDDSDPIPPIGYPFIQWGSNWADSFDTLESDFLWMYDDGIGGTNIECQIGNTSGCWGHRNNILGPWFNEGGQSTAMGAYGAGNIFTELFADKTGLPDSLIDPYSAVTFPSEVAPQVVQVDPTTAVSPGTTTQVTIKGNYFSLYSNGVVPTVYFGSAQATNVQVAWDGQLTADVPADPLGPAADTVVVTVVTPGGTSDSAGDPTTNEFTYSASPALAVTGVSPNTGSVAGGDQVTITGSGLSWATSVSFGSTPATNLTINSNSSITVTSPPEANPSTENVTVTTSDGQTSSVSSADDFTYKMNSDTLAKVSNAAPSQGMPVTYSADVTGTGGTPSGTVTFFVGWTTLCTTPALKNEVGSCQASNAPPGSDTVTASYSGSSTFATSTDSLPIVVTSGDYTPLPPTRICDTRPNNPSSLSGTAAQCNGIYNSGAPINSGGTKVLSVAGYFGVPSDATAVTLNVTAVSPSAPGYLTVYPTGSTKPVASNLNYVGGEVVPNLVEVGTGTNGDVTVYASTEANIVVDVEGYVSATAASGVGGGLYTPLSAPARICDTRANNPSSLTGGDAQCNGTNNSGSRLGTAGTINVLVAGNNGVPATASAAVLNLTVVGPAAAGYLTVYAEGGSQPTASNVNYTVGQTTNNRVIVPLSTGATPGEISIYSSASADVVVDISGYYSAAGGTGSRFTTEVAPARICDTRSGNPSGLTGSATQCDGKTVGTNSFLTLNVTGLAGVPSDATAVVVNLTGVAPSLPTFLTVYPGPTIPFTSDLDSAAGEVMANMTVATLSSDGTVSIYNDTGSTNVVVDVLGWYS
jgi:hypothetical protein